MNCPKCGGFVHQDARTFWWIQDTHCVNCGWRPGYAVVTCEADPEVVVLREQGRQLAVGEMQPAVSAELAELAA